ncbi:MAG TPA: methyltransferase [Bacteroidota bacterium]|nr:methyltransferase [Bacteroidota bacterium]
MPAHKTLQFDDLRTIAYRFQESRILLTAFELGVFTALRKRRMSSAAVAEKIGTNPRATDRLLNALVVMQLLEKNTKGFANSEAASRLLAGGSGEYLAGLAHTAHLWISWSTLTDAVREGSSVLGKRASIPRSSDWLESFIAAMHDRAKIQAPAIVGMIDLTGVHRVLDVGGGPGTFAMAFVRARRSILATVFDLPSVLPITRRYIQEGHCEKKIDLASGDYTADPLPKGYDLVFLSAVIHSNSAAQNKSLIRKCAKALNPGGRVIVQDWIMDEMRIHPAVGAFFSLNMLVGTSAGDTYTEKEVRSWMNAAGLSRMERKETPFAVSQMIGYR